MLKHEKMQDFKEKVQKFFDDFCNDCRDNFDAPFNSYTYANGENIVDKIISYLKEDYDKFFSNESYKLQFVYPYKKFKNKKGLKDHEYKKLKENYTEEEQVYFIIANKLKSCYSRLDQKNINLDENSTLTIKQWFNYNYFIDLQPRCCFCGQLLENIINDSGEDCIIADIEHIIPKSQFPQFTLHPTNWAPCCKECNEVIKGDTFFCDDSLENFKKAMSQMEISFDGMHPLRLWKYLKFDYISSTIVGKLNQNLGFEALKFLNFYKIEERAKVILSKCYSILFNIIRNSDIRSPESLERLLENIASSNWHEVNDGYSLNNSPKIWQEFIEYILYDENNLLALWEELKDYSNCISCYHNI